MKYLWLIPVLPAAAAAVNGLLGIRYFNRAVSAVFACAAIGGALALSLYIFASLLSAPADARVYDLVMGDWIPQIPLATAKDIGMFKVAWSFRADPLASVMLLVVTGVGFLIHVYASAYMRDEPAGAYARFFCYLNLFCAFMLLLVLAGNFVVLFVGWEGVGLCSYLLIGFWYEKSSAAEAGKKAFLVNRLGDAGFLLGIFLIFFTFGTVDIAAVAAAAASMPPEAASFGVLSAICLLLCAGAVGKSAQIPLFVWLPDAMEGPTPVSALIHAATMVTAGVYIIARNAVLFEHAPLVMAIVAIVGALTALMAAAIGLVQTDIKRVLAYSTMSQVGYMFLAAGVGAFGAAVFHLATHAFFKALLFLGSGAVIHALAGEQDMRRMGGLKERMPVTFATMLLAALALAGIPPLAGFFSKDEILSRALGANPLLYVFALATSLLTAVYISRLMALTFFGSYRGPVPAAAASQAAASAAMVHGAAHPHDAQAHGQAEREEHEVTHGPAARIPRLRREAATAGPRRSSPGLPSERRRANPESRLMLFPMLVLALGAIVAGFVGVPAALGGHDALGQFLEPSFHVSGSLPRAAEAGGLSRGAEAGAMFISVLVAITGLASAWYLYLVRPDLPQRFVRRWRGAHALLCNQFYVDELYDATIVRGTLAGAQGLRVIDRRVVDAAIDGLASLTQVGAWVSHMIDKYLVDAVVNGMARGAGRGSFLLRRLQTGLVQNYALLMVFGLVAFLTLYLFGGK
jgi:NADH-quinone oxidoreductase subunit L